MHVPKALGLLATLKISLFLGELHEVQSTQGLIPSQYPELPASTFPQKLPQNLISTK